MNVDIDLWQFVKGLTARIDCLEKNVEKKDKKILDLRGQVDTLNDVIESIIIRLNDIERGKHDLSKSSLQPLKSQSLSSQKASSNRLNFQAFEKPLLIRKNQSKPKQKVQQQIPKQTNKNQAVFKQNNDTCQRTLFNQFKTFGVYSKPPTSLKSNSFHKNNGSTNHNSSTPQNDFRSDRQTNHLSQTFLLERNNHSEKQKIIEFLQHVDHQVQIQNQSPNYENNTNDDSLIQTLSKTLYNEEEYEDEDALI